MLTLSDRIGILLGDADQLRADVNKLCRELSNREGIESIVHLADVPGDLLGAENGLKEVVMCLDLALKDVTLGGE